MKYLIFGSAWYIEDWCERNQSYLNKFCLVTINNSIKVLSKYCLVHRWYMGTDFLRNKYTSDATFNIHEYCNYYKFGHPSIISGDFLNSYYCPMGGTMILNVCYDLLNKSIIRKEKCTISIIGCDLIYDRPTTHFYTGGTNDPLRLGIPILKNHLNDLKNTFDTSNNLIFNLSNEVDTLLPFDKITIEEFLKLNI